MATKLTVCRGCLRHADREGEGQLFQAKVDALQKRLEQQLGPVDLELEECLHHCFSHEVCISLERPGQVRTRCTHLKQENPILDPVELLLAR
jgi:hypothetical protein